MRGNNDKNVTHNNSASTKFRTKLTSHSINNNKNTKATT